MFCYRLFKVVISFLLTIGLFFFLSSFAYATGPSEMKIKLTPVSVNEQEEVLARYYYWFNQSGGFGYPVTTYGWCIINQEGEVKGLNNEIYDPYETTKAQDPYQQYIEFTQKFLPGVKLEEVPIEIQNTIRSHGFTHSNANEYYINGVMPFETFKAKISRNNKNFVQHSLLNGKSEKWGKMVHIMYSIGNLTVLANYSYSVFRIGNYTDYIGAMFDYKAQTGDLFFDYEIAYVDGWIVSDGTFEYYFF
jgi:hypothetical protein